MTEVTDGGTNGGTDGATDGDDSALPIDKLVGYAHLKEDAGSELVLHLVFTTPRGGYATLPFDKVDALEHPALYKALPALEAEVDRCSVAHSELMYQASAITALWRHWRTGSQFDAVDTRDVSQRRAVGIAFWCQRLKAIAETSARTLRALALEADDIYAKTIRSVFHAQLAMIDLSEHLIVESYFECPNI
jgi:hypothetical protein